MIKLVILSILFHVNINVNAEDTEDAEPHNIQPRMVGGDLTSIISLKFVVSIQSKGIFYAAGCMLTVKYIITTASPFHTLEHLKYTVRLGSSYYMKGGTVIAVKKIVKHPKYSHRTGNNDLLIMKLAKSAKDKWNPKWEEMAAITSKHLSISDHELLILSGWGTPEMTARLSAQLRTLILPKANFQRCKKVYAPYRNVTSKMFCLGGTVEEKGPCYGDSGAPVVLRSKRYILVGLVSFGRACGRYRNPAVASSVIAASDWVLRTITPPGKPLGLI